MLRCFIRLKRKDGVVMPIQETCRKIIPKIGDVIMVEVNGNKVRARVERLREGYAKSPRSDVEPVHYITAVEL